MRSLRATTLAASLILGACMGSSNYWMPYQPARGSSPQPRPTQVQRAVIAISDAGRELESTDSATGVVLTKWFSSDGFGGDQTRFRVRVIIDEQGGYDVAALCQTKNAATPGWSDECDRTKRPRFVLKLITQLDAALKQ